MRSVCIYLVHVFRSFILFLPLPLSLFVCSYFPHPFSISLPPLLLILSSQSSPHNYITFCESWSSINHLSFTSLLNWPRSVIKENIYWNTIILILPLPLFMLFHTLYYIHNSLLITMLLPLARSFFLFLTLIVTLTSLTISPLPYTPVSSSLPLSLLLSLPFSLLLTSSSPLSLCLSL